MYLTTLLALVISLLVSPTLAEEETRTLFSFDTPESAERWQTVNDGVMGGRSDGRFKINQQHLDFYGRLSLENNGGFASVRYRGTNLGLKEGDSIVARVRGDGREYSLNLYVPRRFGRYSYRQSFKTSNGQWSEVTLPIDAFVATYRGRVFPKEQLDPAQVNGLGFLLGDKRAGLFNLEIDWVRVISN